MQMTENITPEEILRFWNKPTGFEQPPLHNKFIDRLAKERGHEICFDAFPMDGASKWHIITKVGEEYTRHFVYWSGDYEDDARALLSSIMRPRYITKRPGRHDFLAHGGYNSQWLN